MGNGNLDTAFLTTLTTKQDPLCPASHACTEEDLTNLCWITFFWNSITCTYEPVESWGQALYPGRYPGWTSLVAV